MSVMKTTAKGRKSKATRNDWVTKCVIQPLVLEFSVGYEIALKLVENVK